MLRDWRRVLLAVAGLGWLAFSLGVALHAPMKAAGTAARGADFQLYEAIVERLRQGEGYYSAAGRELRTPRGPQGEVYPTRSVFNWRLPTLAWLQSRLASHQHVAYVYQALSLLAVFICFQAAESGFLVRRFLFAATLATGLLWGWLPEFAPLLLAHECWAGLLIALSLMARARGWWVLAVAAGLLALFIRELALPYVLMATWMAARQCRWRELAAWLVGLAGFAVLMAWHSQNVFAHMLESDRVQAEGWLRFGGWAFILKTAHLHPLFLSGLLERSWIVATLLPASLLGLLKWNSGAGPLLRATVAAYLLAYACVGQPFNYLWGLLYTPLWPLGLLFLPELFAEPKKQEAPAAETARAQAGEG